MLNHWLDFLRCVSWCRRQEVTRMNSRYNEAGATLPKAMRLNDFPTSYTNHLYFVILFSIIFMRRNNFQFSKQSMSVIFQKIDKSITLSEFNSIFSVWQLCRCRLFCQCRIIIIIQSVVSQFWAKAFLLPLLAVICGCVPVIQNSKIQKSFIQTRLIISTF